MAGKEYPKRLKQNDSPLYDRSQEMVDQPVISAILPTAVEVVPAKSISRRVLCGGLFGMTAASKAASVYSPRPAVRAPVAAETSKKEPAELS